MLQRDKFLTGIWIYYDYRYGDHKYEHRLAGAGQSQGRLPRSTPLRKIDARAL